MQFLEALREFIPDIVGIVDLTVDGFVGDGVAGEVEELFEWEREKGEEMCDRGGRKVREEIRVEGEGVFDGGRAFQGKGSRRRRENRRGGRSKRDTELVLRER